MSAATEGEGGSMIAAEEDCSMPVVEGEGGSMIAVEEKGGSMMVDASLL